VHDDLLTTKPYVIQIAPLRTMLEYGSRGSWPTVLVFLISFMTSMGAANNIWQAMPGNPIFTLPYPTTEDIHHSRPFAAVSTLPLVATTDEAAVLEPATAANTLGFAPATTGFDDGMSARGVSAINVFAPRAAMYAALAPRCFSSSTFFSEEMLWPPRLLKAHRPKECAALPPKTRVVLSMIVLLLRTWIDVRRLYVIDLARVLAARQGWAIWNEETSLSKQSTVSNTPSPEVAPKRTQATNPLICNSMRVCLKENVL
jgi:hypothetical protein